MLTDEFKKTATEKVTAMSANEYKEAFKAIGSKPLTNEEWFDTLLTTEEKAEAIFECVMANSWNFSKNGIKMWLKQPHSEIK